MPTVFVAANGNDAARCTHGSPCRSLGRAYRVAALGSVVEVAGGSYGRQAIDGEPAGGGRSGAKITFRPAPKATVSISDLTVSARHIVFAGTGSHSGFSFGGWQAMPGASDVTFRNVSTKLFGIIGSSNISIIGGQVGPWDSSPAGEDPQIKALSETESPPTNILISGVYFHDITKNAYPDYHTDCLQFLSGQHVVIRNNVFARCSDTDLFIRSWARGPADSLTDFVIEHNVFGRTTSNPGYYDLQLADSQAARLLLPFVCVPSQRRGRTPDGLQLRPSPRHAGRRNPPRKHPAASRQVDVQPELLERQPTGILVQLLHRDRRAACAARPTRSRSR